MDSHGWRRELDKFAELKGILVTVNPAMEEQSNRQVRHLYDIFANLSKFENDLTTAGILKKGSIKKEVEKSASELEDAFMRATRDFAEHFRKEHQAKFRFANESPRLRRQR